MVLNDLRPGPDAWARPRGPRLEAPGVLQHGMARGIERRAIVRDDRDRADLVRHLGALAQAGVVTRAEALSGSRCRAVAYARVVAGAMAGRALGLPIAGRARARRLSPTAVRAGLAWPDGLAAERGIALAELLRARARNPR